MAVTSKALPHLGSSSVLIHTPSSTFSPLRSKQKSLSYKQHCSHIQLKQNIFQYFSLHLIITTEMASSSAESSRTGGHLHEDSWTFDLLEHIFTYLPIKQCVQMGLVAREFRQTWRKCRNLDFGREFAEAQPHQLAYSHVVDLVLDGHNEQAKIKTLRLCFDSIGVLQFYLEEWVHKSFEKGVEELDLDIFMAPVPFPVKVEDAKLKELKLYYSTIQLPFDLKALVSLTTLVLRHVNLTDEIVEAVFESCPQLKSLDMANCYGVRNMKVKANKNNEFEVLKVGGCLEISSLEIHAPSLRCLYYNGAVKQINIIEPLLLLNEASLIFLPSCKYTNPWLVEKLVADISVSVRVLTITSTFLEGLAAKMRHGSIRETQFCFSNLRELQIVMQDQSFTNAGDVAAFIKNCPMLENLFIDLNENTCESEIYSDMVKRPAIDHYMSFFNALEFVKIRGFKVTNKQHVRLARFILERAVFLQRMVLIWPRNNSLSRGGVSYLPPSEQIRYTNILAGWKLSPMAEIVLCNQREDVYSCPKHARKWF